MKRVEPCLLRGGGLTWKGLFTISFIHPLLSFFFFRFLNRLAIHPVIRKAEEFKTFLENPGEVRHSPPRGFV